MKHVLIYFLSICMMFLFSCGNPSENKLEVPEYTIGQFMDNRTVFGGSFSPDYTKLLVGSDKSGIFNAYSISVDDGEMTALSSSEDEAVWPISYFPDDERFLFSSDNNGDEIDHIFVQNTDGTGKDLTPQEGVKSNFAGWNNDRSAFYYLSNARDPNFMDVYKMDIESFEADMLYENASGLDFSGISRDERYIALNQTITTSSSKLFLMDRNSGDRVEVSREEGSYGVADFSIDNTELYYLTNSDGEFAKLMKYNMESMEHEVVLEKDWDIMYAYFSQNGTYRVAGVNEDASTKIYVTDMRTGEEVDFPDLGSGDISGVGISRDEQWIRFYFGNDRSPKDLYLHKIESDEAKKLTNNLNPELDPEALVSSEIVRFKSFDGLEIPAVFYKPKNARSTQKAPALVWVHGGPGGQTRVGYSSLIQYLVNHGYAVLGVNNRGSSGYGKTYFQMDDQNHGDKDLKDCIAGKDWLAGQDYIDASKIGIIGGSYGGYMVMQAMSATPDEFEIGVNIFGVTNWIRTLRSIPPWWGSFKDALYKEMGNPNTQDSVRLYEISPLFHADKIKNPVMVLQGATDPRVLQIESDEMVEEMKKNNVDVEYLLFEDEGHGFVKKENQIEAWTKILEFLDTRMKDEVLKD